VILISRLVIDPKYIREAIPGKLDAIGLGLLAVWLGALQIVLDKGQEDDWFGAVWIRWAVVVLVVAFVAFLYRELTIKKPLVDLRILLNRNFAIGCLQIAIFGAVVYGMITILPLFYQTLMGYTALAAGLAVAPRGIGAIFAMPLVGVLLSKYDGRKLIAVGFGGVAVANIWLGHMTLDVSQWSMFWAVAMSGFFIGFVFVPLATLGMGALPDQQIGNASGLYNLFRNVGGSVGISIVNTIVSRHEQLHRTELAHSLSLQNPEMQRAVEGFRGLMSQRTDPVDALHRTYKLLEGALDTQAALWSYIDDFRYLALVCFAAVPIAFALTRVKPRKAVAVH
jgi:MFS transporter, DHA2 family, multidrug resistance protein